MALAERQTPTRLKIRPLNPALGAEVRGVDMRKPLDPATFNELHDAWMEHLIVVLPEQHVTDEEHVSFTRNFGEPEIFHQTIMKSKRVREIFRVSNVDDDGNLLPAEHPTVKQLLLTQTWHTDSSYRTLPCTGSLLHGVEVSRTGGETEFTNMYKVYEALPEKLKQQVEGRKARHDFEYLHTLQPSMKPSTAEERAAMPPVWQPLERIHPVTRRKALLAGGAGFGALALAHLLRDHAAFAAPLNPLTSKPAHRAGKAKSVIFLFMEGGPSHLDTFDPKPLLNQLAGQPIPASFGPRRR